MLIKSLVIKKDYLTTVNERATLAEALKILEDSGYRCVPIVDDTGTIFRGNVITEDHAECITHGLHPR